MSRLLVVQNDPDKTLGRLRKPLIRAGAQLDVRSPGHALPSVGGYDGLAVLPGLANPVDGDVAIRRARGVIHDALQARIPVLGLCLGAELLVEELGGSVYPCRPELGFGEVSASPGAAGDPLLGAVPERFSVFHAHSFAFEPPTDAEILLTNEVCVQACRYGDAWAIQCHPEASREWVASLAAGIRGEDTGLMPATAGLFRSNRVAPEQLERDADAAEPTLLKIGEQIAKGFALRLAAATAVASEG